MPNDITLNEDEQDCLQEFMNISFGTTVAAISKIIDNLQPWVFQIYKQ